MGAVVFLCCLCSVPTVPKSLQVRGCACFSLDLGSEAGAAVGQGSLVIVCTSLSFSPSQHTLLEDEDWLLPPSPVPRTESCSTGQFLQPVSQTNELMVNARRTCQEGTGLCHLSEKTMGCLCRWIHSLDYLVLSPLIGGRFLWTGDRVTAGD